MGGAPSRSLQLTKLQALAGAPPWSDHQWAPVDFGPGAALRVEDGGAPAAVLFPSEPGRRSLGEALVWADRHGIERLDLVIDVSAARSPDVAVGDDIADVLARRAGWFAAPDITVYRLVTPAGQRPRPELVEARPLTLPPAPDLDHPLVALMADGDLEIVAEGGIARGEFNGLEVARVVPVGAALPDAPGVNGEHKTALPGPEAGISEPDASAPGTGAVPSVPGAGATPVSTDGVVDGYRLDVGVGQADRELTAYVHAGADPAAEVTRVRDMVREQRRGDAARHPLNQLVPERWLRAAVTRHPERLGLAVLRPLRRVPARVGMTETAVAAAEGTMLDGRPVVAVFSAGMDTDLVPSAAEMLAYAVADRSAGRTGDGGAGDGDHADRSGDGPGGVSGRSASATGTDATPALWLVVPERDVHPVTRRLAARLREHASVVPVPDDWRTW